ncbi:GNAT family N-acetyltransferase [Planococcus halotolerans]|uniref:GNAT family N-acetyltransferase n=1 Tax=Planococcus halotolerans TaxID=2233542 RepID=A0A365KR70_9BACL|nr:GNAT family N-acetyltransferase [Planococcus halotolerans]QHJ69365.1 GNAT family N-acetyltransferase [Planococcus halotolerans]RAZ75652.1 GNAT family N-acetyltransferase [Planococcus halotolerans]
MEIRLLKDGDDLPLDLLLEADPSEEFVRKYCGRGCVYEALVGDSLIGVYVLLPLSGTAVEIKNIAVAEDVRGRGYGKKLILHALSEAKRLGFANVEIGTGNSSVNQLMLYQKCGFRIDSIDRDFFTRNYPEPIIENGIECRDMIRLVYTF